MRTQTWLPLALAGLAATACDPMSPGDPGNLVPRTVAEDATLPAIEMNGSRFHAETFGDPANPVIVFLHGGPGGDYRGLLRLADRHAGYALADDYYVVFWDQRGSGLSQREGKANLNVNAFVHDLNTLIDRYAPGRKVFLIGESWGGMFATRYINQYPQRVAGAVLIEPGPLDGVTMERLKDDIGGGFGIGAELTNDILWNSQFFSPDDHAREDFERMLGARDAQPKFHLSRTDPSPNWRMGAAANRYVAESGQTNGKFTYDFTTNLSAYTTPVLFIAGSQSEVLGASLQQDQMHRFPSASLQVVNGAGHDVAWVKAAEVHALIRTYLNARRGGQP